MKNDGKEAERAFVDYWSKIGHLERLRDKADLTGLNGGAHVADFAKPSDFLVSSRRHPLHYAEVKSTNNATSFAFGKIQKGQSKAALLAEGRGAPNSYIFYIFSYPLGQWFCMNCTQYALLLEAGRRSVKFEELLPWKK